MRLLVLLVFVAVVAVGCMRLLTGETIPGAKAREIVANGGLLVDVRTPQEFQERHAPGAVNVPVAEVEQRLSEFPKDRPIVVYCRSGVRSGRARKALLAAGYREVYNLGGLSKWDEK